MSELRRRAAFWRNMEYAIDQLSDEVQSRSADKWFDNDDAEVSKGLTLHLGEALNVIRMRYCDVLRSQIEDWSSENEK
ncbi:MAG: hypothetical protein IJ859_03805 [Synergistaceae bacterium]|nr:hypothetical protein [Synergistaceae bacterium]